LSPKRKFRPRSTSLAPPTIPEASHFVSCSLHYFTETKICSRAQSTKNGVGRSLAFGSARHRLLLILCCEFKIHKLNRLNFYNCLRLQDCAGRKNLKKKQFPPLVRTKKLRNSIIFFLTLSHAFKIIRKAGQNRKRGIIIRCCGFKKCIGRLKKKPTASLYGNSSSKAVPGIKSTPQRHSTFLPVKKLNTCFYFKVK